VCVAAEGREPFLFAPLIEEREKVLKPPKKKTFQRRESLSPVNSSYSLIAHLLNALVIINIVLLKRRQSFKRGEDASRDKISRLERQSEEKGEKRGEI
jgi:hypothetical protein